MNAHANRFTAALRVAALLIAGLLAPLASAQHSSGNIAGVGKAGDVVRIERADTGFMRMVMVDKEAKYRVPRLPIGPYVVTVTHADGTVDKSKSVQVQAGTTTRVK